MTGVADDRAWTLVLLVPAFLLFAIHFRRNLVRYADRRGGRRLSRQRVIVLTLAGVGALVYLAGRFGVLVE